MSINRLKKIYVLILLVSASLVSLNNIIEFDVEVEYFLIVLMILFTIPLTNVKYNNE